MIAAIFTVVIGTPILCFAVAFVCNKIADIYDRRGWAEAQKAERLRYEALPDDLKELERVRKEQAREVAHLEYLAEKKRDAISVIRLVGEDAVRNHVAERRANDARREADRYLWRFTVDVLETALMVPTVEEDGDAK